MSVLLNCVEFLPWKAFLILFLSSKAHWSHQRAYQSDSYSENSTSVLLNYFDFLYQEAYPYKNDLRLMADLKTIHHWDSGLLLMLTWKACLNQHSEALPWVY
jgi:hypothetical protein